MLSSISDCLLKRKKHCSYILEPDNGIDTTDTTPSTKESYKILDPIDAATSINLEDIDFVCPIPEERYEDVKIYINEQFRDEPLKKYLGLAEHSQMDIFTSDLLSNKLSVMVEEKASNKIIAVALSTIKRPGLAEQRMRHLRNVDMKKLNQMELIIDDLNNSVNLYFKFNVETIFSIDIFSIDVNCQDKKLGRQIVKQVENIAKENTFQVLEANSSDPYFLSILSMSGWNTVEKLYNDVNKVKETEAHETPIKVMVKHFENDETNELTYDHKF